MNVDCTVAVVTGGAHRLGKAIVLALADAGCNVTINYHASAPATAEETACEAEAIGARAITHRADVTQPDEVAGLLDATLAAYGRVDVLVANAGVFRRTPFDTLKAADWDAMMTANLRSAFLCAHRFGLHMRAQGGGSIIFLADVAGLRPWADYLPYSVAKACIIALTRGLAKELAPTVRVNAIAPGPILFPNGADTALREREVARTLLRRQGDPQNVTDAVLMLIRNDYITGTVLPVDGGRLLV